MDYLLDNKLAQLMGIQLVSVHDSGVTTRGQCGPEHCNVYGFAHGGFIYTLGHVSAQLAAKKCLDRNCAVVNCSCEYLSSLRNFPARGEAVIVRATKDHVFCRVSVMDNMGRVCFKQMITLRDTNQGYNTFIGRPSRIRHNDTGAPVDPVTGVVYPRRESFLGDACHCYITGRGERGMLYGIDLVDDITDEYGYAHGGAIYTACDAAAAGSMALIDKHRPVTVGSNITYMSPAMDGPLSVEAKLVRSGKTMAFYDVEVTDRNGTLVAMAQFIIQQVEYEEKLAIDILIKE